jgi:peptide/nickel transport system permease protein
MSLTYVFKRILLAIVVIWVATTFIFFLPRVASERDPIAEKMAMLASTGGVQSEAIDAMVKIYKQNFGMDRPIWQQYLSYMGNIVKGDFNYSLSMFPSTVLELIGQAIPWTIGLLTMTTLISFALGSLLGGLLAWPRSPGWLRYLVPPLVTLSAVPYYLLGIIFIYLFAFHWKVFPLGGGSEIGTLPAWTLERAIDILAHSVLPALSIVASAVGFWTLAMRGMMVTTLGEDYITLAEAKGLRGPRIFFGYAMRNALLPQMTSLALSLGHVLSGALLVEVIFRYPGIGMLLYKAITGFDYFTISGVVFFIIVTVSLATLIIDLAYPLLDPRIRYQRA